MDYLCCVKGLDCSAGRLYSFFKLCTKAVHTYMYQYHTWLPDILKINQHRMIPHTERVKGSNV